MYKLFLILVYAIEGALSDYCRNTLLNKLKTKDNYEMNL